MPSQITTPGRTLLREILPEEVRLEGPIRKDEIGKIFSHLAKHRPEEYVDILDRLNRKAVQAATEYGDTASFGIKDLDLPESLKKYREDLRKKVNDINQNPSLTPQEKNNKVVQLMTKVSDDIRKRVIDEADEEGNKFAFSAKQGVRGNPVQISQLLFGDLLMADHKGRPVPVPGLHGYGEGLTPAEFFAGAYGSRAGFASVQLNTQKSGYLTKQLSMLAHNNRITGEDCGADTLGIPVEGDDPDMMGNVLAQDAGGLKKGHVVREADLSRLKDTDEVTVRSLLTCQQPEGVCKLCAGLKEDGKFPDMGEFIGVERTRMVGEPITQGMLCLHPDTEVRMGDKSVKKIKDIKEGDKVSGIDREGNKEPVEVVSVYHGVVKTLVNYSFEDIDITCSPEHKVLTEDEEVKEISLTGWLKLEDGTDLSLTRIKGGHFNTEAFDIEVDNKDHLFVLANGMVVSNSSKHVGGVIEGSGEEDEEETGFQVLERIFNVPSHFPNKAVLAPQEGDVKQISEAPQGGHYIIVGNEQVHVPEGRKVKVTKGDHVDAGDVLSGGVPNPKEIAEHKGIGAGRVYFLNQLTNVLEDAGIKTHMRNLEPIAREFFNRVEVTDPDSLEGYTIGDIVPYSDIQKTWHPRQGSKIQKVDYTRDRYLEKPVLEYTIGTRITPKVQKRLKDKGVKDVVTSEKPPPFKPVVPALRDALMTDPDFRARLGGWNLKKTFMQAAREGGESPRDPTSYLTGLMDPRYIDQYPGKKRS